MTDAPERIWAGNWLSDAGEIKAWDIGEWRAEPWPTVPTVEYVRVVPAEDDAGDDARIAAASRREWAERAWRAEAYIDDVETAKGGLNLELIKQRSQIAALEAEGYRLRPLAEKWVAHLENRFEQSGDDGAAYHDWQAALAALNGEA